jgi:hypothetical protein
MNTEARNLNMKHDQHNGSFAALVRAYCEARGGLSMAEAARRLRIPYRTLQDWALGLHAPRGFSRRLIEARLRRP